MAAHQLPDQSTLAQLFRYDPADGRLFWRKRDARFFAATRKYSADRAAAAWNAKHAGREALTSTDGKGYLCGALFKRIVRAHRIIWKLCTGDDADQIDHINGDRADNRISNLRGATNQDNHKNMRRFSSNKSGTTGVLWFARTGRWRSEITVDGKNIHLGYFLRKDDAIAARQTAEAEHRFHHNHGRS